MCIQPFCHGERCLQSLKKVILREMTEQKRLAVQCIQKFEFLRH